MEQTLEASELTDSHFKRRTDPFNEDPFEAESSTWSDPSAFYDRPRLPRPLVEVAHEREGEEEEGVGQEQLHNLPTEDMSSDFTGGSANYWDTTEFLRREESPPKPPVEHYNSTDEVLNIRQWQAEGGEEQESTHIGLSSSATAASDDDPGQYDFPSALSRYPTSNEDGGKPRSDVPLPPIPFDVGSGTGRLDMPLPPLPSPASVPILPARLPNLRHSPSAQITSPVQPSQSLPGSTLPPLPPRNRAAGNGSVRTASPTPQAPLSSAPSEGSRGGPSGGGPRGQAREEAIMELVQLGYSRSDVVRALAVASNDFNLAKLILKEFGLRP